MLNIIDINTNASRLEFIEELKAGFRARLSPTVKIGTVVIISQFPAIGNMLSSIDYLVLLTIPKLDGNYFKVRISDKNKYVYNAVLLIKTLQDDQILSVDDSAFYSKDGQFDYLETNSQNIFDFRDYCLPKEDVWAYSVYQVFSANAPSFYNNKIVLNHKLPSTSFGPLPIRHMKKHPTMALTLLVVKAVPYKVRRI
jgi:hypothetical protein